MKQIVKIVLPLFIGLCLIGCKSKEQPVPDQAQTADQEQRSSVAMVTTMGTITIDLYNETPLHRDNFLKLAREQQFDSLLFHRVIENFMIQGGDPDSKNSSAQDTLGNGDLDYMVPAEFSPKLFHKKGVLAAARDDNPEKGSSAMQFYLVQGRIYNDSLLYVDERRVNTNLAVDYYKNSPNKIALYDSVQNALAQNNYPKYKILADSLLGVALATTDYSYYYFSDEQRKAYKTVGGTAWLDQNYTVYGEITSGLEVVDAIAQVNTDNNNRPQEDVRILSVRVLEE